MDVEKESVVVKDKLYANLIRAVIEALQIVFADGRNSDSVVKTLLKSNPKWGSRDRKFLAETVYETVRWWRKLWMIYGKDVSLSPHSLWGLLGVYFKISGYDLPDWKEFDEVKTIDLTDRIRRADNSRVLRESIPDWLDELCAKELGDRWDAELHELNKPAPVIIRVNTLKTTLPALLNALKEENVRAKPLDSYPDALQLDVRQNIFRTKSFSEGLFEVQDASSQEVAYFMDVKPGMRVIDACAGGGGKTLHIASLMHNKGRILALDIHEWKLKELQKRAARAGVSIVETRMITSSKVVKRLEKNADRLLLDVPCTGLGVLRRNPDIKWKLDADSVKRIIQQQTDIISSYSKMLKNGGKMIYATCSILPSENENVVAHFLSSNPEYKMVNEKKISPSESTHDGFYMALIERQ